MPSNGILLKAPNEFILDFSEIKHGTQNGNKIGGAYQNCLTAQKPYHSQLTASSGSGGTNVLCNIQCNGIPADDSH